MRRIVDNGLTTLLFVIESESFAYPALRHRKPREAAGATTEAFGVTQLFAPMPFTHAYSPALSGSTGATKGRRARALTAVGPAAPPPRT